MYHFLNGDKLRIRFDFQFVFVKIYFFFFLFISTYFYTVFNSENLSQLHTRTHTHRLTHLFISLPPKIVLLHFSEYQNLSVKLLLLFCCSDSNSIDTKSKNLKFNGKRTRKIIFIFFFLSFIIESVPVLFLKISIHSNSSTLN